MKLGRKERTATITKGDEHDDSPDLSGNGAATDARSRRARGRDAEASPRRGRRAVRCAAGSARLRVPRTTLLRHWSCRRTRASGSARPSSTMGALNERELILVLAELLHMPVVDLRRHNPDPELLSLIPEQVVREHMAMPIRLDDDGLQVAVSDQPSVAVRALLDGVDAAPDPLRARARSPTSSGPSTAATEPSAASTPSSRPSRRSRAIVGEGHRNRRDRGRRRRRANRAGRHPHPDPGQARPRLRRAHRAVPGRRAGALPH